MNVEWLILQGFESCGVGVLMVVQGFVLRFTLKDLRKKVEKQFQLVVQHLLQTKCFIYCKKNSSHVQVERKYTILGKHYFSNQLQ